MLFHRMDIYFHIFLLPTSIINSMAVPRIFPTGWEYPFTVQDRDNPQNRVPHQSPHKENSYAPQGLLLERVYPGAAKQTWHFIPSTETDVLEARPVQPASPGHCPCHSQQVPTGDTQRKAGLEGEGSVASICTSTCTPSLLPPTFPRASIKMGWWLDELSANSCASHTLSIL